MTRTSAIDSTSRLASPRLARVAAAPYSPFHSFIRTVPFIHTFARVDVPP